MVLCAGLGTRLRPLTEERPKPLVPVGDRSLLAWACDQLALAGHEEVVLNTHHLPGTFESEIEGLALEARVVHEPRIRGTAGGVAGARSLLAPPLVVWNGDIRAEPPLQALADAAVDGGLVLAVAPRAVGQGTVGLGADRAVVRLRGERFGSEAIGGDYIGVAGLGADVLSSLPELGCMIGDVALPRLRSGQSVRAVPTDSPWTDAGDLNAYLRANLDWLGGRASWVGPDAHVGGRVELDRTVIGGGARVEGPGRLERCVVWPGATVTAPLRDAVATPRRIVSVESG